MTKKKKSNGYRGTVIVIALALVSVLIAALPVTAADVSVIRNLPDDPVYPGEEISVSLNQSGFLSFACEEGGIGTVTEQLPEGFTCRGLASGSGGDIKDYDRATNNLTIDFACDTTVTYLVETGTAEQIETAVFSGIWKTTDSTLNKISGEVEGDTTLTLGTEPTPTPTSDNGDSNGGSNGGGSSGGGTTTPTLTPTATATATPGETPSPSLTPGATVTPMETSTPGETPAATPAGTPSPTSKPLILGFGAVFALAGLLAVAYVLIRR